MITTRLKNRRLKKMERVIPARHLVGCNLRFTENREIQVDEMWLFVKKQKKIEHGDRRYRKIRKQEFMER